MSSIAKTPEDTGQSAITPRAVSGSRRQGGWRTLHDTWWRLATQNHPRTFFEGLTCGVLRIGSMLYWAALVLRDTAWRLGIRKPVRIPAKVVSVGNLTVGGTGKTTCVEWVTRVLMEKGKKVAILSRGYGGRSGPYWLRFENHRLLVDGRDVQDSSDLADEPKLLARRLGGIPILVDAKRAQSAKFAYEHLQANTLILDDGFQHRQLARDCDIVLVHARLSGEHWHLLPRGPLREPWSSLKRAHIVIVTHADEAPKEAEELRARLQAMVPEAIVAAAAHEPYALANGFAGQPVELSQLAGKRVALLSSIGDPRGFEETVKRLGAKILWHHALPDHHAYAYADWRWVYERVQKEPVEAVVTTLKDWMRLEPIARDAKGRMAAPLWVLKVRLKILKEAKALNDRLNRLYDR